MAVKRLIKNFVPENYKVFFDIDRQAKTIKGKTEILGEAKNSLIGLHAKDLQIKSIQVLGESLNFTVNEKDEEIAIQLKEEGRQTLIIDYEAILTDNMSGIYPSYYEIEGLKKQLIGTQFESHFARQAFPCIDEPEAKATFDLSVKFDEVAGEMIVANMPEIEVVDGVHIFEQSVKMSSYLLAFVFGDMQAKYGETKSGIKVGAFSTKAHSDAALDFPLDIAIRAIDFYEEYYKTPYPLPHSWHIALPDFSAGAMENWGCITYREVCMLVDPENATVASKQYVALVIAHELAHQWFGDLVTMRWWDDLWLNESFANNMEYVCLDALEPDWKVWESFSTTEAMLAFNRDATDGVQSVHVEVNHPDEISSLFDGAIVYAKGSRLMVMLNKWLGDQVFSEGLHQYFEAHKYGNTVGSDLWKSLSEVSGKDVSSFMDLWVNQPGYPLVTAELLDGKLKISQHQFFIGEGEDKGRLWQIPLNANYEGLPDILSESEIVIDNFKLEDAKPLLLNAENTAHYIIHYKGELLESILSNLSDLSDITKFQVIQDQKYLAKGQLIGFDQIVKLLPHFNNESSYIVNQALNQLLSEIEIFVDADSPEEKALHSLIIQLFEKEYARLGWEKKLEESSSDETLRGVVLGRLISAKFEDAVTKASEIFVTHKEDLSKIPADIRPIILRNEIKASNSPELVQEFMNLYVKTSLPELKRELSSAVSNIKDKVTVEKLLTNMKNSEIVKPQDISFAWLYLLDKDFSQNMAWQWAQENWAWLEEKLGGDMSFDKFVVFPGNIFKTAEKLNEFKTFFAPKSDQPGLSRAIAMAIKQIESRVTLVENQKVALSKALLEE
ncbi:MAG: M1 family metallopeptidase [Lactovum sp.]